MFSKFERALSLVELLVVIGIIAVIIGILLPVFSAVRAQANLTVCMSNLHTIGQAIHMYANAHGGTLPEGYWDGTPPGQMVINGPDARAWPTLLIEVLSKKQPGGEASQLERAFKDTDAHTGRGVSHYSAHPRLMPDLDDPDFARAILPITRGLFLQPCRLSRIARASQIVLVMDGVQIGTLDNVGDSWGALPTARTLDRRALHRIDRGFMLFALAPIAPGGSPDANGQMIDAGPNQDAPSNFLHPRDIRAGNIRWRHQRNTTANFLFVDGHVEPRKCKSQTDVDLRRYNINVN